MLGFMFCSFFLAQVYRIYVNSRKLMGKTNGDLLLLCGGFLRI